MPETLGNPRHLPAALSPLIALPHWIVWRWEWKAGRWTKVPYQPRTDSRVNAKTDDPKTWGSYQQALKAFDAGLDFSGVGFVLTNSPFAALDLDKCRTPETGEIATWAQELLDDAATYIEITPSGTGLRIIGVADEVDADTDRKIFQMPGAEGSKVEIYRGAVRYITMSGLVLGEERALVNIDGAIEHFRQSYNKLAEAAPKATSKATDAEPSARQTRTGNIAVGDLRPGLRDLIIGGVEEGQRSDQFHHVVGWLHDDGWSENSIVELLERYPDGIAKKYGPDGNKPGRVRQEVRRCLAKARPTTGKQSAHSGYEDGLRARDRGSMTFWLIYRITSIFIYRQVRCGLRQL